MPVGKQNEYDIKLKSTGKYLGYAVSLNETGACETWCKSSANSNHLPVNQVTATKR